MKFIKPLIRSIMIFFSVLGVIGFLFALCMASAWLQENIPFLQRFDLGVVATVIALGIFSLLLGFFLPDDDE